MSLRHHAGVIRDGEKDTTSVRYYLHLPTTGAWMHVCIHCKERETATNTLAAAAAAERAAAAAKWSSSSSEDSEACLRNEVWIEHLNLRDFRTAKIHRCLRNNKSSSSSSSSTGWQVSWRRRGYGCGSGSPQLAASEAAAAIDPKPSDTKSLLLPGVTTSTLPLPAATAAHRGAREHAWKELVECTDTYDREEGLGYKERRKQSTEKLSENTQLQQQQQEETLSSSSNRSHCTNTTTSSSSKVTVHRTAPKESAGQQQLWQKGVPRLRELKISSKLAVPAPTLDPNAQRMQQQEQQQQEQQQQEQQQQEQQQQEQKEDGGAPFESPGERREEDIVERGACGLSDFFRELQVNRWGQRHLQACTRLCGVDWQQPRREGGARRGE
ncbi:hypothetical protein Esti_002901 [Eimeria stiedai]